jgi:hypothetical protein
LIARLVFAVPSIFISSSVCKMIRRGAESAAEVALDLDLVRLHWTVTCELDIALIGPVHLIKRGERRVVRRGEEDELKERRHRRGRRRRVIRNGHPQVPMDRIVLHRAANKSSPIPSPSLSLSRRNQIDDHVRAPGAASPASNTEGLVLGRRRVKGRTRKTNE